jgi:hypothetical protein
MIIYAIRVIYIGEYEDEYNDCLDYESGFFKKKEDALALCKTRAEALYRSLKTTEIKDIIMDELKNGFKVIDNDEEFSTSFIIQEFSVH